MTRQSFQMSYWDFYEKYSSWLDNVKTKLDKNSPIGCHILQDSVAFLISSPRIYQDENHNQVDCFNCCSIFTYIFFSISTIKSK